MYIIFSSMTKENKKTKTENYTNSFAFGLVGCLLRQDKRLFETIEKEMQAYAPFLLEHEYFNEKETRMEFFSLMESISELAQVTKSYSKKELDLILKTLSKKALKKLGKELNHA